MSEKPIINIADVPLMDRGNGKSFAVKWGRVGPALGLNALGCAVHVVPPGKKAFPFHRHHVMDELFYRAVRRRPIPLGRRNLAGQGGRPGGGAGGQPRRIN